MKYRFFVGLLAFLTGMTAAITRAEFLTDYEYVTITGDFVDFDTFTERMQLIDDYTWQGDLNITNTSFNFKFATRGFTNDWGHNTPPNATLPIASKAISKQGDIPAINNTGNSAVRFIFNERTAEYSVFLLNNTDANNLYNGGFETAGTVANRAKYWQWSETYRHGDTYGSARREIPIDSANSGTYVGAIPGRNLGGGINYGGFWQDAPIEPGVEYEVELFYKSSQGAWTAETKEIKIEYFDFNNKNIIEQFVVPLLEPTTTWQSIGLTTIAPAGASWLRLVINAGGIGESDILYVDDVKVTGFEANRQQNFDTWLGATTDTNQFSGGWQINVGKVTEFEEVEIDVGGETETTLVPVSRSGLAASLPPGNNVLQSPRFDSVGVVRFWYRNGAIVDEADVDLVYDPVAFEIQTSADGTTWTTRDVLTNITTLSYREHQYFNDTPGALFIRILNTGSTNRLLIDDVEITPGGTDSRFQAFDTWPSDPQGWILNGGTVTTTNAKSGLSGKIFGSTNEANYLQSPLFSGYGEITFSYARGNNGFGPATLRLEESQNGGTNWTPILTISNITQDAYAEYTGGFYSPTPTVLRFVNQYTDIEGTFPVDLIKESFEGGPGAPSEGWTIGSGVSQYTSTFTPNPPALKFDGNQQVVTTPLLVSPTNLSFYIRGAGTDSSSSLLVEGYNGSSWTALTTIQPLPTTLNAAANTPSLSLDTNITQIRFTYTRSAGNLAFDDVYIQGVASADQPQSLMLDDIEIRRPREYRNQNFDTWPVQTALGASLHQGWSVDKAVVIPDLAQAGNAAELQLISGGGGGGAGGDYLVDMEGDGETKGAYAAGDVSLNGLIWNFTDALIGTSDRDWKNGNRSARLRGYGSSKIEMTEDKADGLGTISFGYARYGSDAQVPWRVEYSRNGGTWTQIGSDFTATDTPQTFSATVNQTGAIRIRITTQTTGSSSRRLNVDDILLTSYEETSGPAPTSTPAFIQSPRFTDGIGSISFFYRNRNTSPSGDQIGTLSVQTSSDGINWTAIEPPITVDQSAYQRYEHFIPLDQQATANMVRIALTSGTERVVIEDIRLGPFGQEPADVLLIPSTEPTAPFTNDTVQIRVRAIPVNGADSLSITAFYRIGDSGPFTESAMLAEPGTFVMEDQIPPQPNGARVEYYFEVEYEGPGAISPKTFPAGAPENDVYFYAIPRDPPGRVWINEVSITRPLPLFGEGNFFVELAGWAGQDIGSWRLVVQDNNAPNYDVLADYTFSAPTVLEDDYQGYGFFLVQDSSSSLINADVTLTNDFSDLDNVGIQLINEAGTIVDAWSFNARMPLYEKGGDETSDFLGEEDFSTELTGSGSLASDFTEWENYIAEPTPGSINGNQVLEPIEPETPQMPPDIDIVHIAVMDSVTLTTVGNTNSWSVIPYYSHDLMDTNNWSIVSNPSITDQGAGQQQFNFAAPSTNRVMFFQIRSAP